jgi:hypothetical protein
MERDQSQIRNFLFKCARWSIQRKNIPLLFCPAIPAFSDKTRLQGKQALARLENQFENALTAIGSGCISTDRNFLHKKYAAIIS